MSHTIEKSANEYRLYVAGCGVAYIAYAEHVVADEPDYPSGWRVNPDGIAEHLDEFVVQTEEEALLALEAIGFAYEAGGGGGR